LFLLFVSGVLILLKCRIAKVQPDAERLNCISPSWSEALRVMSQSDFLATLLSFDKDTMNGEMCEFLEPYLAMPDFKMEVARKVCGDVAGLCAWVRAMVTYHGINREVIPLKEQVIHLEKRLAQALNGKVLLIYSDLFLSQQSPELIFPCPRRKQSQTNNRSANSSE
jgi:dynein heavy chain